MKLHFSNILLFAFLLNILTHNKNKSYVISHHTQTTTSRVLSECDTQSSNYDKDTEMKSVKESFDRQSSKRFEEYEERMKEKRQKRKEQRDKNIQKIIHKDKMEKNVAEKIEKGCLRCGCALGGVAASVGLIGAVAVSELKKSAMAVAIAAAQEESIAAAIKAGHLAGTKVVISGITREFGVSTLGGKDLGLVFDVTNYTNVPFIYNAIKIEYNQSSCLRLFSGTGSITGAQKPICTLVAQKSATATNIPGKVVSYNDVMETTVKEIVTKAITNTDEITKTATEEAIKASTAAVDAKYFICQNAIIASVVAILIIVLVMIIIYLVLRYRRKKKMNKKAEYTKLLNQ
ncbi:rifin [Plasmodium reichenowi]|uniref:Rifin n=1 Tax=Plasmodium reichenowi TaxID=5854 RepID=A0A060RR79_PLARE|nr:rifin [Plasmodium reichenowi]